MKIAIYITFGGNFGRFCQSWATLLRGKGHTVDIFEIGFDPALALPVPADVEVNLIVAGAFILNNVKNNGLPSRGKTILWLFEPTTRAPEAVIHKKKALNLHAFASRLDAFIGMDSSMVEYMQRYYPGVPTFEIPFTIAPAHIHSPVHESAYESDMLMLGHHSRRREDAHRAFQACGMMPTFIWGDLWGEKRDEVWRRARISLCIQRDAHSYFDQFRTFHAWAAGSLVVTEPAPDLEQYGIQDGRHLVVAGIDDFPDVCRELLADSTYRRKIVENSQELLKNRYMPEMWLNKLCSILAKA